MINPFIDNTSHHTFDIYTAIYNSLLNLTTDTNLKQNYNYMLLRSRL